MWMERTSAQSASGPATESRKRGGERDIQSRAPRIEGGNTGPIQAPVPGLCLESGRRNGMKWAR